MDGVNLPRIEIPKFDVNILNSRPFWEQFRAAVHDKPHLGEVDRLTYLRDAIKGGPAMYVIQRLTQSTESYPEAIKCLHDRYDRPRIRPCKLDYLFIIPARPNVLNASTHFFLFCAREKTRDIHC